MKPFEYARPETEAEALELLNEPAGATAVLAGGTDLLTLLKRELIEAERVVDLKNVAEFTGVSAENGGVLIGALTTLEDALEHPLLSDHRAFLQAIRGVRAIQMQQSGTIGGDLCHLPNCWYFRNGYGLLGRDGGESLVESGDNRYHAIFGNRGPARFVSATRFAPGLIAFGARVRVIGPAATDEEWLPLEYFYATPRTEKQGVTVLKPGQLISHVWVPEAPELVSATYEVQESEGLDWPLAACSSALELDGAGLVRDARIVLGHVAPTPWVSREAASALLGQPVTPETARAAGEAAVAAATPMSGNEYKVRIAQTCVTRSLLKATGQWDGV